MNLSELVIELIHKFLHCIHEGQDTLFALLIFYLAIRLFFKQEFNYLVTIILGSITSNYSLF